MQPTEGKDCAVAFLEAAVRYYAGLGITIRKLLTDNGAAFRSKAFARACVALHIKHRFTKPYCPQTNGKASASFNRLCANGLIGLSTNIRISVLPCSITGPIITTGIDLTKASVPCHLFLV
jgi:transposase InsO family protein